MALYTVLANDPRSRTLRPCGVFEAATADRARHQAEQERRLGELDFVPADARMTARLTSPAEIDALGSFLAGPRRGDGEDGNGPPEITGLRSHERDRRRSRAYFRKLWYRRRNG